MSRKKIKRILIEIVLAAFLIFLLVFFLGYKVTKVEVEGNKFYKDSEIKSMILDVPIAQNSILALRIKTEEKTKDAKLIDGVTISRKNRNTLVLHVKEKEMIGYIRLKKQYIYFDRQGIIRIITDKPIKDVPFIEGLSIKTASEGEKLKGVNARNLNTILSVGKMLEKTERKPDRLLFNEMRQLVLHYGEIEVRLGSDENMDEKMNRMIGILPALDGMQGILHLENITENTETVVFDQAQENEDTDSLESDEVDVEDASKNKEKDSKDKDTKEKDPKEQKAEDDKIKEESDDPSELDYSDGSDAAD